MLVFFFLILFEDVNAFCLYMFAAFFRSFFLEFLSSEFSWDILSSDLYCVSTMSKMNSPETLFSLNEIVQCNVPTSQVFPVPKKQEFAVFFYYYIYLFLFFFPCSISLKFSSCAASLIVGPQVHMDRGNVKS